MTKSNSTAKSTKPSKPWRKPFSKAGLWILSRSKPKYAAIEAGEDAEGVTRAAMSAISGKTDEELDQLQAEQPEHYTQLKTTAELFPAAMQDSELGEIPEGWEVKSFGEITQNYSVW